MPEYFEDLTVGDSRHHGSHTVTREEILSFAEQYDPQPFHTDPEAAAESPFGGLVASGWHTASRTMRLLVDDYLRDEAATHGALGVDELRWLDPVRPGDELTVHTEIEEKSDWSDAAGKVDVRIETRVDGETVLSMVGLVLFARRSG